MNRVGGARCPPIGEHWGMSTETAPAGKRDDPSVGARRGTNGRRPRDMIISLAVLLVPIGVVFVGWRFLMSGQDVNPVDFGESVDEAKRAGLSVVEPDGLSDQWVPISHSVDGKGGVTLRIGYHTPDEAGVQLVESDAEPETVLEASLGPEPRKSGGKELAGREWTVYKTVDGHNAYVSETEDMTIAVVGDAAIAELDEFVGTLN